MTTRLVAGVATAAMALAFAEAALAQTTATQAGEVVVTGARGPRNLDGVITQVQDAKDESIITQQFMEREGPGENIGQLINLIPGVSFVSEDPTGISSGDLRIHGQTSDRIAINVDGAPVNDTGNYATYVGEYLIAEAIDHVTVNLGATDVDSPSAAATAGAINITSKLPNLTPGVIAQYSAGNYNFEREYAEADSGVFGPYGTRAYASFNMQDSDKYKGSGTLPRIGTDGALYQPLGFLSADSFAKVSYTYVQERADFYTNTSRAQLAQYGRDFDYNQTWFNPTVTPGKADGVPTQMGPAGNDGSYYAVHPNPVDFGQIRGNSYLNLTHGFHFTFDPYFFYTRANGGGTSAIKENDPRLIGSTNVKGVDLNGDGDTLDTVLLYTPSDTQTHRYGVNTSLLWDPDSHNHFQATYTLDYGEHRQTSPATYINGGQPDNVFGGTDGYGPPVLTSNGTPLETGSYGGRNRYTIATLNQFAFNYIGKYLDDRLHVNLGVRDPFFVRHLNNYCYEYNGTNAYCTSASESAIEAAYNTVVTSRNAKGTLAALQAYIPGVTYNAATGLPNLQAPETQRFSFNKPLPNVGATYRLFDHNLLYITYTEGFSAPKNDDLYTSETELVKPETSTYYGTGWRYQDSTLTTSLNYWYEIYRNRIVSSPSPEDPTVTIDRNIGKVDLYGIDAELGKRLFDHLVFYGSASWNHSRVVGNEVGATAATATAPSVGYFIPTDDKQLVDTPEYTLAGRLQYEVGPASIGLEGKYTSYRYTTDVNDDRTPGFAVWNLDARYNLNLFGYTGSYVQVNITNLFDRFYLGRIASATNSLAYTSSSGVKVNAATPYYYVGAPRDSFVTLRAAF